MNWLKMHNAAMENSPKNAKRKINIPWLFEMAWRDSRRNRSRLMLFISAIIFGIAALVAIYSFRYNLEKDIDAQAATLIGADLEISGSKPADASIKPMLDSLGDHRSQQRMFVSMIYFPKNKGTRLVQVRALQGGFPYYGSLETTPVEAGQGFKNGKMALVDKTLMLQFNARVNDSIKVGNVTFLIAGVLNKAPGQTGITSGIAPLVYIPLRYLEQTGLSKRGSRINFSYFYKYDKPVTVDKLTKSIETKLDKASMNYETIQTRKEGTGRSFADLTRFLSLVGFIALLLGCVGVASAIHIYIREKIASIAIMRCLGVKASEAFLIYLIQIVGIGIIGSM
ncbi:MAG: ABC transporter permease, partial [Bacteroidota bacterium]|nr:ABC transporter permease [Bacteroidota bacterium]